MLTEGRAPGTPSDSCQRKSPRSTAHVRRAATPMATSRSVPSTGSVPVAVGVQRRVRRWPIPVPLLRRRPARGPDSLPAGLAQVDRRAEGPCSNPRALERGGPCKSASTRPQRAWTLRSLAAAGCPSRWSQIATSRYPTSRSPGGVGSGVPSSLS